MAGAGFKTFNTGDVLTAADVNTYLMQQTVMVFASAAARTTALGANVAEGMLSYLKDTDQVEVYNGTSWVASDDPNAIQNSIVDAKGDLITATADNVPARIGVGTNGQYLSADSTTATGLKWVTPPSSGTTTFTIRKTTDGYQINAMAYNGSNLYVAVGNSGRLFTSPDAQTWTSRTSGFGTNNIQDVFYANNLWVAVGNNGTITTSSDGVTWTARTSNMSTNIIRQVRYANSIWVAIGQGGGTTNTGGITYSTDGITWTRKSQSVTIGAAYHSIVWNGTNWIIAAPISGGNNYMYASAPSGTWTVGSDDATGGTVQINALWYDGSKTIMAMNNTAMYYTSNATLTGVTVINYAAEVFCGVPSSQQLNVFYNGKIHQIATQLSWFSTTLTGFNAPDSRIAPINVPTVYWNTVQATYSYANVLLANASGYVIGTLGGEIWTSF